MKLAALLVSLFAAGVVAAQPLDPFERVLLPVYGNVIGYQSSYYPLLNAYGETATRMWPAANGDESAYGVIPQGASEVVLRDPNAGAGGRLMFVERSGPHPQLDLKVLVRRNLPALSPTGPDFTYVRMPVVREQQFLKGDSRIIGVPFAYFNERDIGVGPCCERRAQFRHMLRVYDLSGDGGGEFVVTVDHPGAPGGRVEHRLTVSSRDGDDPSYPWYAQVPLENYCFTVWPSDWCASFFGVVELRPADPTREYWAFVTSTHNLTHDIAVSTP